MLVQGDNWDAPIFSALDEAEIDRSLPWELRRAMCLDVVLKTIGQSLRHYLAEVSPLISRISYSDTTEATTGFVDWLGTYYLVMHEAFRHGLSVVPNWGDTFGPVSGLLDQDSPTVYVTFQIGFPLLCPAWVKEATGNPPVAMVHQQNPYALEFLADNIGSDRLFNLESASPSLIPRLLKRGVSLVANIDSAYPGTRVASLPLLGTTIAAPAGIFLLAQRVGVNVRCLCILQRDSGVEVLLGQPIQACDLGTEELLQQVGDFFDEAVRAEPFQWQGWPIVR